MRSNNNIGVEADRLFTLMIKRMDSGSLLYAKHESTGLNLTMSTVKDVTFKLFVLNDIKRFSNTEVIIVKIKTS